MREELPTEESMTPNERMAYVHKIRSRMNEDVDSVSTEELAEAVRCIVIDRATPKKRTSTKKEERVASLDDF